MLSKLTDKATLTKIVLNKREQTRIKKFKDSCTEPAFEKLVQHITNRIKTSNTIDGQKVATFPDGDTTTTEWTNTPLEVIYTFCQDRNLAGQMLGDLLKWRIIEDGEEWVVNKTKHHWRDIEVSSYFRRA